MIYGDVPVIVEANYFVPGTQRDRVIVGGHGALVADFGRSTVTLRFGRHHQLESFLPTCQGRRSNPVPVEVGVHALEVVEAAARAARFDRVVSIAEIRAAHAGVGSAMKESRDGAQMNASVESRTTTHLPRAGPPWFLVAAGALLTVILVYALLGAYVSAKHRAASLERELHGLYAREAELYTKVVQYESRLTLRDQRVIAVTRERDALARRLQELEGELETIRRR